MCVCGLCVCVCVDLGVCVCLFVCLRCVCFLSFTFQRLFFILGSFVHCFCVCVCVCVCVGIVCMDVVVWYVMMCNYLVMYLMYKVLCEVFGVYV